MRPLTATATTADGITHRLWAVPDPTVHAAVEDDLRGRRALIADGHHRYATYRERQRLRRDSSGPGAWDRGLALLVDSSDYGPQVHPIHRVIPHLTLDQATGALADPVQTRPVDGAPAEALAELAALSGFAAVLTDGTHSVVVHDPSQVLAQRAARDGDPPNSARST